MLALGKNSRQQSSLIERSALSSSQSVFRRYNDGIKTWNGEARQTKDWELTFIFYIPSFNPSIVKDTCVRLEALT